MNPSLRHSARPTRARYIFLVYAAALSLILYLDRICIAESAEHMKKELGLDEVQMRLGLLRLHARLHVLRGPQRRLGRSLRAQAGAVPDRPLVVAVHGPDRLRLAVHAATAAIGLYSPGIGIGSAAGSSTASCCCCWSASCSARRGGGLSEHRQVLVAVVPAPGARPGPGRGGDGGPARRRHLGGVTIVVTFWVNNSDSGPGMGWRVTFWLFGVLGVVWASVFACVVPQHARRAPVGQRRRAGLDHGERQGRAGAPALGPVPSLTPPTRRGGRL